MDWTHVLTSASIGVASAITALSGAYFWIRGKNQKLMTEAKADEYKSEKQHEDDAIKRWQEFAEYQQKTFRQKNEEQDARYIALQLQHDARLELLSKKLDDMHHAHLKCERDSMEREILLKKESAERQLELQAHKREIDELQKDLTTVKQELAVLTTKVSKE